MILEKYMPDDRAQNLSEMVGPWKTAGFPKRLWPTLEI